MRIRLIKDDEAAAAIRVGDSTLWVRRVSESRRREIAAARRREILNRAAPGDRDSSARFMESVEDDIMDHAIVRWEGLDGDPPCDRESKAALPDGVKDLVRAYLAAPAPAEAEGAQKNSPSPSATRRP